MHGLDAWGHVSGKLNFGPHGGCTGGQGVRVSRIKLYICDIQCGTAVGLRSNLERNILSLRPTGHSVRPMW